jgi:hypothetical protein
VTFYKALFVGVLIMKIRTFILLTALMFNINIGYSRQDANKSVNAPIIHSNQIDSLTQIVEQLKKRQIENERYFEIIQRTNEQLSLWWNPYGALIATLGVLFAILTIIAALIVFRQSAEHRAILNKSIQSYQNILNKFLEDKNIAIAEKMKELEEKLITADEKSKKDIQETLAGLKLQREFIDNQIASTKIMPELQNIDIVTLLRIEGLKRQIRDLTKNK